MVENRLFMICGSPQMDLNFIERIMGKNLTNFDVFAVDKGLEICSTLNLPVKKIIGDFDSVDPKILDRYSSSLKYNYPKDKDQSDTEIAISIALKENYQEIFLLNADGARMDHFLFNTLLLFIAPMRIKMITSSGTLIALKERKINQFHLQSNSTFSLIPLEKCSGVSITGCKFPLNGTQLNLTSLTLSNIALEVVTVQHDKGKLLFFSEERLI
ncbi:thiamine diphosphokinase [Candidatus Lokiarchaeum ossiferum]|uniref:thiamine diphosphokinase n=1 Tax=Candidatus Lokiarchaeum ossiferum TaxID=2951803 RepID=UPI00352EF356